MSNFAEEDKIKCAFHMRRLIDSLLTISMLAVMVACTPEDNNGEANNNQDELTVTGEASAVTDCSATLTGYANLPLEMGDAEVGIVYDTKQSFEDGQKVAATGLDGNKFTLTITGLSSSTTYYYKSYVQNGLALTYGAVMSFTTKEHTMPEGAVDLGIVMTRADGTTYKLYWAKSNLCADGLCPNPEDYGDYYAWGETETKDEYNWSTYKWANGDNNDKVTKYCPTNNTDYWDGEGRPDNKTVLDTEDDVAHVILGGSWRMQTDEEWTELITQCTWTWTTENGVNGQKVTGTNGNSIFLPAAGSRFDTGLYNVGLYGNYWSSSLGAYYPNYACYAWLVDFSSDFYGRDSYDRYYGFSIRPVSE